MNLHSIQKKVRAAKDKRNDFGGYSYRNAEGILAELKSVLPDGWAAIGSDDMREIGPHLFLCHTARIVDADGKEIGVSTGWAMHPETKKGMDPAQITGSCSSYAKKYAWQNLLAIDDGSVDPDATNKHDKGSEKDLNMAFQEMATQNLTDSELENEQIVAGAIADAIEAKVTTYKNADWAEKFMKSRAGELAFIERNAPERYGPVRAAAWAHIQELKKVKT